MRLSGFSKSQKPFLLHPSRCSARIHSWPCSFLSINDLPASLPSSVSCSLYADDLAIWFSFPLIPTAVEATQGALFRLERWSEYWCLPLNPSKCEAFFLMDPHQANLQPNLQLSSIPTYSAPAFVSTQLQLFLGSPLTALFPFLSMFLC